MNRIIYIFLGSFCIFIIECSSLKKGFCAKQYMNKHKFVIIKNDSLTTNYFIIKDSLQTEFLGTDLYSESVIIWNTCDEYSLILKRAFYQGNGLQSGDTLLVKIKSFKKDTLELIGTAYNHSFPIKVLRSTIK